MSKKSVHLISLLAVVLVLSSIAVSRAKTQCLVARRTNPANTLWVSKCEDGSCDPFTQISGFFTSQPTVVWDHDTQRYYLYGTGLKGAIFRRTLNMLCQPVSGWEKMTPDGFSASPIGAAAGDLYQIFNSVAGKKTRIMALGDSISRGSSSGVVPDNDAYYVSFRKALWDKLTAAGYEVDFAGSQKAGWATDPDFDPDHEGHGGWHADQIAANVFSWLSANPADIVLLHIGINDIRFDDQDPGEIEDILQEIDRYENSFGKDVWVVLALIINRSCVPYLLPCPKSSEITTFNNDVKTLVAEPRKMSGDNIITADMENGAGIDYRRQPQGDMWDDFHPFETGYVKMADVWFSALEQILLLELTSTVKDIMDLEVVVPDDGFVLCRASGTIRYHTENSTTQVLSKLYLTKTSGGDASMSTYSEIQGLKGVIAFPFTIERWFTESGRIDRTYYLTGEEAGSGINAARTYVDGVNMTCQFHPYSF